MNIQMCSFIVLHHGRVRQLITLAFALASDVWHHQALAMTQVCKVSLNCRDRDAASWQCKVTFKVSSLILNRHTRMI